MRATVTALTFSLLLGARGDARRAAPPDCSAFPQGGTGRAATHDNRVPAGTRRGDTLQVSLVARAVVWYPEGEASCGVTVLAFAEEGKAASVPGPLLRVPSGTVVRARVRNEDRRTLWLRGFHDRPWTSHLGVELPAGAERDFTFRVTTPGTWTYQGTLASYADGAPVRPFTDDSQLLGALVVDEAGAPAEPRDRVLIVSRWVKYDSTQAGPPVFAFTVVNGRSWPHTERLSYAEGDSIHWRVINGGSSPHPLHLHGFYFRVDEKTTFAGQPVMRDPRLVVTEVLTLGQAMRVSWRADRPGNWLFHCHLLTHMSVAQRLDQMAWFSARRSAVGVEAQFPQELWRDAPPVAAHPAHDHATTGMAGLIVGVEVRPRPGSVAAALPAAASEPPRRMLRLYANERKAKGGHPAAYGFVLQSGPRAPARDSVQRPGSTIVLRRGEPVQITVFNRVSLPLSVHWHGLELDSYYDGVGGWSGSAGSIAPPIAPGDSFVVRLTPPRSGTYMYHVHGEDGHELSGGLYAPLLVVDDPARRDTTLDRVMLISDAGPRRQHGALLNGTDAPRLTMVAGRPHRLRLIGIQGDIPVEVLITKGADTLRWRVLARDGAEATGERTTPEPTMRRISAGTIVDVEFVPPGPGELTLQVMNGLFGDGKFIKPEIGRRWTAPITVVAPQVSTRGGRR